MSRRIRLPRLVHTRSRRILAAFHRVWARIPAQDRVAIEAMLEWVQVDREWQRQGLSDSVDPTAAGVFPLQSLEDSTCRPVQIRLSQPVCRLFSDQALVGIVAHELAHVARIARDGLGWADTGWDARMEPRHYEAEERSANALARKWGFAEQIRAMRSERRRVVQPTIEWREPAILRQIQHRDAQRFNARQPPR